MGKQQPGDTKRAVAYLRTSTEAQDNGLEAQRAAIVAWAARSQVTVAAWHEEHVSGGAKVEDRPALLDALSSIRSHGAGIFIAAKRDRIARDVVVAATVEKLVLAAGAVVVTADGVSVEDTPEGALMRTMLDGFAAYERSLIRSRTKAAIRVLKAKGQRHCFKAPFGQVYVEGRTVAAPVEVAQIERVRSLRASGLSFQGVADAMNRAGERCRSGRWHATQVQRILAR